MECEHINAKDNIQVMLREKQHSLAVNNELEGVTPLVHANRAPASSRGDEADEHKGPSKSFIGASAVVGSPFDVVFIMIPQYYIQ
jgi:hypothetical protein